MNPFVSSEATESIKQERLDNHDVGALIVTDKAGNLNDAPLNCLRRRHDRRC